METEVAAVLPGVLAAFKFVLPIIVATGATPSAAGRSFSARASRSVEVAGMVVGVLLKLTSRPWRVGRMTCTTEPAGLVAAPTILPSSISGNWAGLVSTTSLGQRDRSRTTSDKVSGARAIGVGVAMGVGVSSTRGVSSGVGVGEASRIGFSMIGTGVGVSSDGGTDGCRVQEVKKRLFANNKANHGSPFR